MTPLLSSALLRTQSDARLASLARDGHDLAFEAIVERYRKPLHAYCRRMLPEARAEDVVQQTFLSAWTALSRGDDVRELRAWLYRIAHNTGVNNLKRSGYAYDELRDSLEHADTPEHDLERRTVMRETLAGVAALPENQREALLRTAIGGASQADIARDLGVTDGAVRQLVHRARATLRAAVTAVTPWPVAAWAAAAGGAGNAGVTERIGELAAGAGTAGVGGMLLKGGAAVVVAGAIATPATIHHVRADDTARAADPPARTTEQAPVRTRGATTPVSTTPASSGGEDRRGGGSDDKSEDDHSGRSGDEKGSDDRSGRHGDEDNAIDDRGGSGRDGGDDAGERSGEDDHSGSGGSGDDDHGRTRRDGRDEKSGSERSGGGDDPAGDDGGDPATEPADPVTTDEPEPDDSSGEGSGDPGSGGRSGSDDPLPHD